MRGKEDEVKVGGALGIRVTTKDTKEKSGHLVIGKPDLPRMNADRRRRTSGCREIYGENSLKRHRRGQILGILRLLLSRCAPSEFAQDDSSKELSDRDIRSSGDREIGKLN